MTDNTWPEEFYRLADLNRRLYADREALALFVGEILAHQRTMLQRLEQMVEHLQEESARRQKDSERKC
jgi:hypothetical protein